MSCSLDLHSLAKALRRLKLDAVFNLVESLGETDRLAHLAPALLEALDLPFTGASAFTLCLTNDKLLSKQWLRELGLPTPAWYTRTGGAAGTMGDDAIAGADGGISGSYLIKCVGEHASLGLDDQALVQAATEHDLIRALAASERALGRPCFAERFVDGREINVALLERDGRPEVLAPAEIVFDAFPAGKPRIVGYAAKWDEASFEYRETPRRFTFPSTDAPLLGELAELATRCWRRFGLRGYARVDFRVDQSGRPFILEINANPCLSPDAGFAAALDRSGVTYDAAIACILQSARPAAGAAPPLTLDAPRS